MGSVGGMRCVGGMLHEHWVVSLGSMRVLGWAVVDMSLWMVLRLCIDEAGVEVRVLRIVGMQW